jgi:hypothetical protein
VSPETEQDADGNGEFDDVDLEATHANAALTFTNWAANSDRLFVYLVDHGGDSAGAGYFRLNPTQTLTAAELVGWLDDLQTSYDTEITLVIDCCHAGSFVDELGAGSSNRIVIAACEENEPTYFVAGGLVSFSDAFFSGMLLGLNVEDSFLQAQEAMSPYQSAIMDDDGNGLYQEGVDGAYAATIEIGATYVAGKDIPQQRCGRTVLPPATPSNGSGA